MVEVVLADRSGRAIHVIPFVTAPGAVVEAFDVKPVEGMTSEAGAAGAAPLCSGYAAAARVVPSGEAADVEFFVEHVSVRQQAPGLGRATAAAPRPEVVQLVKTVRLKDGETIKFKVAGGGPVGQVSVTYGRTR